MSGKYITKCPYGDIDLHDPIWYHTFDFNRNVKGITPHYDLYTCSDKFFLPREAKEKSFLDIGTASGFFSFEMEKRGAEVVSFDLSLDNETDKIPYAGAPDRTSNSKEYIKRFHKGYWYAHNHFNSKAKVVYGSVMDMPDWLGKSDIVLLGSILQHLRDPLGAIIQADQHVKDTLIICEAYYKSRHPVMHFQANPEAEVPQFWTWWRMSPSFLVLTLKTLGYRDIEVIGPFKLRHGEGYKVPSITVKGRK